MAFLRIFFLEVAASLKNKINIADKYEVIIPISTIN